MNLKRLLVAGLVTPMMLFASQSSGNVTDQKGRKEGDEISQIIKTGYDTTKLLMKVLSGNLKKHIKDVHTRDKQHI